MAVALISLLNRPVIRDRREKRIAGDRPPRDIINVSSTGNERPGSLNSMFSRYFTRVIYYTSSSLLLSFFRGAEIVERDVYTACVDERTNRLDGLNVRNTKNLPRKNISLTSKKKKTSEKIRLILTETLRTTPRIRTVFRNYREYEIATTKSLRIF